MKPLFVGIVQEVEGYIYIYTHHSGIQKVGPSDISEHVLNTVGSIAFPKKGSRLCEHKKTYQQTHMIR